MWYIPTMTDITSQASSAACQGFWPHEWLEECREPVLNFSFREHEYGFYLFSLLSWIELVSVMVGEFLIAALFAVPLYYTVIVKNNNKATTQKVKENNNNTMSAALPMLLTFGVYLPFWIFTPRVTMDFFELKNKLFRFCICVVAPTTSMFRLLEGYYGFTPAHAARNLGTFALYFSCPMLLCYDPKTQKYVKTTPKRILRHLGKFVGWIAVTGIYQSLLHLQHDGLPKFGVQATDDYYAFRHIVDPLKWQETAFLAVLLQLYLSTFGEGLMFISTLLTGIQTEEIMLNPIFESESPSDFWGKRWNLLIHHCLKGGIYKPIRSMGGGKALAIFGAFFASALFHEWVLPCAFIDYPNVHGGTTVFFAWQAMLVALESAIGCTFFMQSLKATLPRPIRSILVVLCGIPFGRWFLDSYVNSNFFEQGHMLLFSVLTQEA